MSKGTPILTVRLSPEIKAQLKQIADREKLSMSDTIRLAFEFFVDFYKDK